MRRLFSILLLFALCLSADAYVITTVTINFTNTIWGVSNYNAVTVNGDSRTFTNQPAIPSVQVLTNNTQAGAAANLLTHIAIYPFTGVTAGQTATTNVVLTSSPGGTLNVTVSSGWATLVTNTYTYGVSNILVVVPDSYPAAEKTNVYSGLAADLLDNANTNRAALLAAATAATWVTGNNTALTNSFNGTNNTSHYGLLSTNDTTHNYTRMTNGGVFTTNAVTGNWQNQTNDAHSLSNYATGKTITLTNGGATFDNPITAAGVTNSSLNASQFKVTDANKGEASSLDGSSLTNLTFFLTTNAINTGTFTAGKGYETNISGNITLGAFAGIPNNLAWSVYIFVTNSSGTDRTVTFPSGTKENGTAPAVFYVTNTQTAEFFVSGWGNKKTNVNWKPHY